MPVAAPAILAGVLHHRGANRIEFDIAHAGEQIGFGLHHNGFIATFPAATGAPVAAGNAKLTPLVQYKAPLQYAWLINF